MGIPQQPLGVGRPPAVRWKARGLCFPKHLLRDAAGFICLAVSSWGTRVFGGPGLIRGALAVS